MNPSESYSSKNNNDDVGESSSGTTTSAPAPAPAVAAAAATNNNNNNDDERIALQIFVMEQLIESYGYKYDIAIEAFDIVYDENNTSSNTNTTGNKDSIKILEECCSYILDNQLDTDHGGPIIPISNCPHILTAQPFINNTDNQNETMLNYYHPTAAICTHIISEDEEKEDNNNSKSTKGKSIRPTFDDNEEDVVTNNNNNNNNNNTILYCSSTAENWVCYTCGIVRCSRYINGHTLNHWQYYSRRSNTTRNNTTIDNHSIVISLTDLSVWCHDCTSYITNSNKLDPIISQLQRMKFDTNTSTDATKSSSLS